MSPRRTWLAAVTLLLLVALLMLLFWDDLDGEGLISFPWHAL